MAEKLSTMSELRTKIRNSRDNFEEEVEVAAKLSVEFSKHIAAAIGDISIEEAKQAVVEDFTKHLLGE